MPQIEHKSVFGLEIQSNSFKVREGSLEEAENIVVSQDDIYKLRRGFKSFTDPATTPNAMTEFQDKVIGVVDNAVSVFEQVASGSTMGDYSSLTTLSPDTGVAFTVGDVVSKARFSEANGNMYFTSDNSPKKIEAVTSGSTVLDCGIDRANTLIIYKNAQYLTTSETYLPCDCQIGYRAVFGRKDANNNFILGAPSEFSKSTAAGNTQTYTSALSSGTTYNIVVASTALSVDVGSLIVVRGSTGGVPDGAYTVTAENPGVSHTFQVTVATAPTNGTLIWDYYRFCELFISLPDQIQSTSYLARIYRTDASASVDIPPDESTLQLIDEFNVSSDDISSRFIQYFDSTQDFMKGEYLYTNPNTGEGRGDGDANDKPPQCSDIAVFKNHTFYADCTAPARLPISLISATSTDMPNGTTITISHGSTVKSYSAPTDVDLANDQFSIPSHGFTTGDRIRFKTDGTLFDGITGETVYYAIAHTADILRYATSYANAIALTNSSITTAGTGTSYVYAVSRYVGRTTGGNVIIEGTAAIAGTTATVTTTTLAHGCTTGDVIKVVQWGADGTGWSANTTRGPFTITVTGANTFTFTCPAGITSGLTIYFETVSDVSANRIFKITQSSSGISTISTAISETAAGIVKAINEDTSSECYAIYSSGENDIPGQMVLVGKSFDASFEVNSTTAAAVDSFVPRIANLATIAVGVSDDEAGVLYISKSGEPEAVPLLNKLVVGTKSDPIVRIIALRDSLLVLKKEGVYRVNGNDINSFQATILDSTISCRSSDSVAVLNNQVYCLSTQGVVAISENAAAVMSRAIEPVFTAILGTRNTTDGSDLVESQTHSFAYESERLYLISTMSPDSTENDTVYVYNQLTNAWTQWDTPFTHGFVNSVDDKAYIIQTDEVIYQERKNHNRLDYSDVGLVTSADLYATVGISSVLRVTGGVPEVGDVFIASGSTVMNTVVRTNVLGDPTLVRFDRLPVPAGVGLSGVLYKAIPAKIKTSPLHGGNVSNFKQFSEFQAIFRSEGSASRVTISFSTDSVAQSKETECVPSNVVSSVGIPGVSVYPGWGQGEWGGMLWGGVVSTKTQLKTFPNKVARTYVPLEAQRATYIQANIEHAVAGENLMLQSMAYTARQYGQRTTK